MTSTFVRLALNAALGFAPILVSGGPAPHPDLCRHWGEATSRWRQQEPPVSPSGGKAALQVPGPVNGSATSTRPRTPTAEGLEGSTRNRGSGEEGLKVRTRRRRAAAEWTRVLTFCVRVPCTTAGLPVPVDVEDAGVDRLEGAGVCARVCAPA